LSGETFLEEGLSRTALSKEGLSRTALPREAFLKRRASLEELV